MPEPLYTAASCNPAYQLDWSYSCFWHSPQSDSSWLPSLTVACETDGIRILQHDFAEPTLSQFLVSTRPEVSPRMIAQRIKGRLQYLVRRESPSAFRRNFALRSIGSTRRDKLDAYLAGQIDHHALADPRMIERLRTYQIHREAVDLAEASRSEHAQYWYNLHLVFVNDARHRQSEESYLRAVRDMILAASTKKGHSLSRGAVLPDHVHLTLRANLEESPEEIALGYMNNLAFACGMRAFMKHSYFVGTFSEYDLGAIPRP